MTVGQVLFGNRLGKVRLAGAVVLIDVPEVGGVVFVMGAGLEDWIQIDRVHPQRLEVGVALAGLAGLRRNVDQRRSICRRIDRLSLPTDWIGTKGRSKDERGHGC